jgi:hypothetical protein
MKVSPCPSSQLPSSVNHSLSLQCTAASPMLAATVVKPAGHNVASCAIELLSPADSSANVKPQRRRSVASKLFGSSQGINATNRRSKLRSTVRQVATVTRTPDADINDWRAQPAGHNRTNAVPYIDHRSTVCSNRRYSGYQMVYSNPAMHYLTVLQPIPPGETGPAAEKLKQMAAHYQRLRTESDDVENTFNPSAGSTWNACSREVYEESAYRSSACQTYYGSATGYNDSLAYYGSNMTTNAGDVTDCATRSNECVATYRTPSANSCSLSDTSTTGVTSSSRLPAQRFEPSSDHVAGQLFRDDIGAYCRYQENSSSVYSGKQQDYNGQVQEPTQYNYQLAPAFGRHSSCWSSVIDRYTAADADRRQRRESETTDHSQSQLPPVFNADPTEAKYLPALNVNAYTTNGDTHYRLSPTSRWPTTAASCALSSTAASTGSNISDCPYLLPCPSEAGTWLQQNDVSACHVSGSVDGECAVGVTADDGKVCGSAADTELFTADPTASGIELY